MKPRIIVFGLPRSPEFTSQLGTLKARLRETLKRDDIVIHLPSELGANDVIAPRSLECTCLVLNLELPDMGRRDIQAELTSVIEGYCELCKAGCHASCDCLLDELRAL